MMGYSDCALFGKPKQLYIFTVFLMFIVLVSYSHDCDVGETRDEILPLKVGNTWNYRNTSRL